MSQFAHKAVFAGVNVAKMDAWIAARADAHPWRAEVIAARDRAVADPCRLAELRVVFGYARLLEFVPDWLAGMEGNRARERMQDRWHDFRHVVNRAPVDWLRAGGCLEALDEAIVAAGYYAEVQPHVREGRRTIATRQKAARTTNTKAQEANAARDARIVKVARRLIANGEATCRTVSTQLIDTGLAGELGVRRVRAILRKADVR